MTAVIIIIIIITFIIINTKTSNLRPHIFEKLISQLSKILRKITAMGLSIKDVCSDIDIDCDRLQMSKDEV